MAYPTLTLDASLTTSRFATPSWTTFASVVQTLDIERGRKSELDGSNPGIQSAVFDNPSRSFDPRNTSGPYYPNLVPGKRTRTIAQYLPSTAATTISYVNIGAIAVANNASVSPALPSGWAVGDLLLVVAAIRNSGTGTVDTPAGWTNLVTSGNLSVLGRIAQSGDTAPTVTFTGGVANATTQAQCLALRGTDDDISHVIVGSATQLNSSAQNVALPGLVAPSINDAHLVIGWKQNAWTSVGTLTGQVFTEISDSPTATGSGASIEIQYRLGGANATFTATNLTVTGGASAISRGIVLAIAPYTGTRYQVFGGWTDAWPIQFSQKSGTATMKASGAFKQLALTPLPDPYTAAVDADNPVAWFRLNEGAGQELADSSGNGHHGRWVPEIADVKTTSGLIAGSDSAVTLPPAVFAVGKIPAAAMPALKGQSIEFWVKIDKPPKPLDVPLELSAEMWSSILFGGGVNIRVWAQTSAYPGAVDFIIGDDASLMTAHLAIATTAFSSAYWYYNLCDGRPHHVVCTINSAGSLLNIFVDGIDRAPYNNFVGTIATIAAYGPIDINASPGWDGSAILDELAFYNTELSATQVGTHYTAGAMPWRGDLTGDRIGRALTLIGWPTSLTDLDDGQSVLGTFTGAGDKALDYLDAVTATEQGLLTEAHHNGGAIQFRDRSSRLTSPRSTTVQTTFSDQAADITTGVAYSVIDLATDDKPAANQVTVKWRGGDVVTVNQSSVDQYGPIPATVTTVGESRAEAASLADFVLAEQSALFHRIRSIEVHPSGMQGTTADRAWAACLGLREGDRVRVNHQPASTGTVISQELWIIGITHHANNGANEWTTTFHLSPAITTAYWVLGTGALGSTAVLAF